MAELEESKKDRKKAPIRSQQKCSNMPQSNSSQNLVKKHKKLKEQQSAGSLLKGSSHVIGANSAAIPYRVSRVAQPTQHKQISIIAENCKNDEDEDELDDTWF